MDSAGKSLGSRAGIGRHSGDHYDGNRALFRITHLAFDHRAGIGLDFEIADVPVLAKHDHRAAVAEAGRETQH